MFIQRSLPGGWYVTQHINIAYTFCTLIPYWQHGASVHHVANSTGLSRKRATDRQTPHSEIAKLAYRANNTKK